MIYIIKILWQTTFLISVKGQNFLCLIRNVTSSLWRHTDVIPAKAGWLKTTATTLKTVHSYSARLDSTLFSVRFTNSRRRRRPPNPVLTVQNVASSSQREPPPKRAPRPTTVLIAFGSPFKRRCAVAMATVVVAESAAWSDEIVELNGARCLRRLA